MDLEELNLDAMLGMNTKQLWLYDNNNDVYIDPPKEVLDRIEKESDGDYEKAEAMLLEEANKKPDWLYETQFWYSDIEI